MSARYNEQLSNLIFSPLMRSDEVERYSGTKLSSPETLGQHITDMSMMCYLIANKLKSFGEEINVGLLLEKCLIHDIDEISTGDLPRNTKYAIPELKYYMDVVAKKAVEGYADTYHMDDLVERWENAKEGKEGAIVKICDMLCVARKAVIEIEIEGNKAALRVTKELVRHIDDMNASIDYESIFDVPQARGYIGTLLVEAHDLIEYVNNKYEGLAEQYNITKNIIEEMIIDNKED